MLGRDDSRRMCVEEVDGGSVVGYEEGRGVVGGVFGRGIAGAVTGTGAAARTGREVEPMMSKGARSLYAAKATGGAGGSSSCRGRLVSVWRCVWSSASCGRVSRGGPKRSAKQRGRRKEEGEKDGVAKMLDAELKMEDVQR